MILRALLKRSAQSILLLFAVPTVWFFALSLAPGDYFSEARLNPDASPATIAKLRIQYGLSQPAWVSYGKWLRSLLHGDMGESIAYHQPVIKLIAPRCRNTLLLTGTSLFLAWGLALAFGFAAGCSRSSILDRILRLIASILLAIPEIVAASFLVYFAARSRLLPAGGMMNGIGSPARDLFLHMLLPVLVLTASAFPVLFRHVRVAVSEVLEAPYIRTAHSFGINPLRLAWGYILPAAANPLLSLLGLSAATLLSGSLLVEVIFGWPGVGPLFLDALLARDTYLLLAPVVLSCALLLAGNFLADLLLFWNDPRTRAGFA